MSKTVTHKGILVRINPDKNTIEHSRNKGTSWIVRCSLTNKGTAMSLTDLGEELMMETTNGIYISSSEGVTWTIKKCL